jgi:hypothetical protein
VHWSRIAQDAGDELKSPVMATPTSALSDSESDDSHMKSLTRHPFIVLTFVAFLIAGLTAGQGISSSMAQEAAQETSTVRFAHVYSGGGPVDVYVDGERLVYQLGFGTVTEFAVLPAGDRQIQVVATDQDPTSSLIDKEQSFDSGETYNVLIGGLEDDLDARVYDVNTDLVPSGQARVRFVPAGPDVGVIDLRFGADAELGTEEATNDGDMFPSFSMAGLGDAGTLMDYQDVPAGDYGIYAREMDSDDPRVNVASIQLLPGQVFDLVVLGQLESDNLTFVPLMTAVAAPCADTLGVGETTDACVRLVHTSADAGEVDIYVDDQIVAQAITYGTVTEFAAIGSGDHELKVVPTGGTVDDAWVTESVSFNEGWAYQATVLGIAEEDDIGDNDLRLTLNAIDLTPLADNQTRLRVTHAVSDADAVDIVVGSSANLFSELDFGDTTDDVDIEAGSYDIVATDEDGAVVAEASSVQLEAGMAYDILAIGLVGESSVQYLILATPTEILRSAQGTPIAVGPSSMGESVPVTPVGAAEATVVDGSSEEMATPVDAAPVTPVITPEGTPSPSS